MYVHTVITYIASYFIQLHCHAGFQPHALHNQYTEHIAINMLP